MKNQPELAKARFFVKSEWNGGFSVTSSIKDFRIGDNPMLRNKEYKIAYDFPEQLSGEGQGPTVCENCMGSLAACLTQTIVAHATSRGIKLDSINVGVEGDIDLRGFFGLSSNIRPGAQQFRVTIKIESDNVDLTGECRYGSAAEQILRFAKNNKIDTIVMGSRRLKGILKIKALGSVARKVSELADCSVLIVH